MIYPTTHNDLAASEVDPLSNQDRTYIEKEGWGGEGRIYNIVNDIGIVILRRYTTCSDPPAGITARAIARLVQPTGLACHSRKKPSRS